MSLIDEVEVSYFRSFYKFRSKDLKNLNVIFGKNDSGKSNLVRSLNLFFSGRIDSLFDFEFPVDFCEYRAREADESDDVRKFLYVKITFNTPASFQKSLGKRFYVKRQWTVSRGDEYHEEMSSSIPSSRKHIATRFLNKIRFIYIPAIKDISIFEMLLEYIHEAISDSESFSNAVDEFSNNIRSVTAGLFENLPAEVSAATSLGAPTQLSQMFQALDFETADSDGQKPKSLTRQRGDGVKVRHIPELLSFISKNDKYDYHIWGLEEPENSLDFSAEQAESKRILEIAKSGDAQIFVTTHSPSFYMLEGDCVEKIYVSKNSLGLSESLQGKGLLNFDEKQAMAEGFFLPAAAKALERLAATEERARTAEGKVGELQTELAAIAKPVILTEGRTDAKILQLAWAKVRGGQAPVAIRSCETGGENAGSGNGGAERLAIRIKGVAYDHPHPVIGLFDADQEGCNAFKLDRNFTEFKILGHTVKRALHGRAYAFCLPAPEYRSECLKYNNIPIEFLFRDDDICREVDGHSLKLRVKCASTKVGDTIIKKELDPVTHFKDVVSGKTEFADFVVPTFGVNEFSGFKAIFDIVEGIIADDAARRSGS